MKRLRIIADGPTSANVRVVDADTGETIDGVTAINIRLRVGKWNTATVVFDAIECDIEAEVQ